MEYYYRVICKEKIVIFKIEDNVTGYARSIYGRPLHREHYRLSFINRWNRTQESNFSKFGNNIHSIRTYIVRKRLNFECYACEYRNECSQSLFTCSKESFDTSCDSCEQRFKCLTTGKF